MTRYHILYRVLLYIRRSAWVLKLPVAFTTTSCILPEEEPCCADVQNVKKPMYINVPSGKPVTCKNSSFKQLRKQNIAANVKQDKRVSRGLLQMKKKCVFCVLERPFKNYRKPFGPNCHKSVILQSAMVAALVDEEKLSKSSTCHNKKRLVLRITILPPQHLGYILK